MWSPIVVGMPVVGKVMVAGNFIVFIALQVTWAYSFCSANKNYRNI